jgi:hypothetical protein
MESGPGYYFFYKTHPAETYLNNYDQYFGDLPNVKLIFNADVKPFILHSDLILQRNCTTAVESWMAGKKVIQINDDKYLSGSYDEHQANSIICNTYEEVKQQLESLQLNEPGRDIRQDPFLLRKFGFLDGRSHVRVGTAMGDVVASVPTNEMTEIFKNIDNYKLQQDRLFQNRVKDFFKIPRNKTLRPSSLIRVIKDKINPPKKYRNSEVDVLVPEVNELYNKLQEIGI